MCALGQHKKFGCFLDRYVNNVIYLVNNLSIWKSEYGGRAKIISAVWYEQTTN
jgi:hypothetical protein